jgi:cyclophilin family peptidyl-prolyl cis-trans isomerase
VTAARDVFTIATPRLDQWTCDMIRFDTTLGSFTVDLFEKDAPVTTQNFLEYVDSGHFTDTVFHRVIPGFVIQGGGMTADMRQKSTRAPIATRPTTASRTAVARCRWRAPTTRTAPPSQFFVNLVDNTSLDQGRGSAGYAVFGCVVAGMDVIDQIARVKTGRRGGHDDVPVDPVVVKSVTRVAAEGG